MSGLCRMFGVSRRSAQRWAAMLAVFAMLGQIAIFTLHRPALALSPFDGDEHALCLSTGANGATPDDGRPVPLGSDLQCPICKTLQHTVAILPPQTGIDVPIRFASIDVSPTPSLSLVRPSSPAQPRAPPSALSRA